VSVVGPCLSLGIYESIVTLGGVTVVGGVGVEVEVRLTSGHCKKFVTNTMNL
jgi:hypothetical protein